MIGCSHPSTRLGFAISPFRSTMSCPLVPPNLSAVEEEGEYNRINLLLLRNTAPGNFLDRCSISLPCQAPGEPPVGFMLTGEHGGDATLFAVASAVEAALAA